MKVALSDPNAAPLQESQRRLHRAEAAQLSMLLDYVDSFLRAQEVEDPRLMGTAEGRATAESAAVMYAAEALGSGEGHVSSRYHEARYARQNLPLAWRAAGAGNVSVRSLSRMVSAAQRLVSVQHIERLDVQGTAYASEHRPAQVNAWLNRFVARLEPEQHARRCRINHTDRRVWLEHLDDGVSLLHALLPTLTAEAIKNRLVHVARSPKQPIPYDPCVERGGDPFRRVSRPEASAEGVSGPRDSNASARDDSARNASAQSASFGSVSGVSGGGPDAHGRVPTDWIGISTGGAPAEWELTGPRPGAPRPGAPGCCSDPEDSFDGTSALAASPSPPTSHIDAPPTSRDAGDDRTQAQREADLVANLLLTGGSESGTPVNAHIGILISAEALAAPSDRDGAWDLRSREPAMSRNRRHAYPAEMIRRIVQGEANQITWSQVPTDCEAIGGEPTGVDHRSAGASDQAIASLEPPGHETIADRPPDRDTGDVLSRVYQSRFVPKLLRAAIEFRDGTCQAPGCMVAAEHCDIDHQTPWPQGPTAAGNLWALCRKHHRLKTAGFLDVPAQQRSPLNK